jgi:hypothetical protein
MYNYELKVFYWFLEHTHKYLSCFPKKCRLIHYLILFGSRNIKVFFVNHVLKFKCLAKRMSYAKVDCCYLKLDAKRLKQTAT